MAANILNELAAYAVERVEAAKKEISTEEMMEKAFTANSKEDYAFEKALMGEGIHFVCECKKASPSKGLIAEDFPYLDIAKDYEAAGASAISVLTEPKWFLGKNDYLKEIAREVKIPVLRKDFTVDEYMIYEAKVLGASAVLFICAILDRDRLVHFMNVADGLGLSAVVEAHDENEVRMAAECGARIIGVNNRNLKDFTVDVNNSIALRKLVSDDILFIAESGIKSREDVRILEENNVNGVLIGESLMRSADKKKMLSELRGS